MQQFLSQFIERKLDAGLIIEIDPIEMVTGDFPQRFLDEFLALAGIEFFLPFILIRTPYTAWQFFI